eukprot:CAMPEP_0113590440 /NCGR_PEP_ID=MMETSP0015_2-20120614/36685_1 /TAXON_ID=2838 /ORGANISM="Odontella" /LENGTH=84 /DNA_ID=CAMNT_0000496651 /DNA_START=13 /DNA_END=263 /DNA_ORIENTATION=- /assembly_acc=CAM_ASM_000160
MAEDANMALSTLLDTTEVNSHGFLPPADGADDTAVVVAAVVVKGRLEAERRDSHLGVPVQRRVPFVQIEIGAERPGVDPPLEIL